MNRRGFLKGVLGVAAAAVLPKVEAAKSIGFQYDIMSVDKYPAMKFGFIDRFSVYISRPDFRLAWSRSLAELVGNRLPRLLSNQLPQLAPIDVSRPDWLTARWWH